MQPLNSAPKGAITTLSQLRVLCTAKATIYKVNGVYPIIVPVDLTGMSVYNDPIGPMLAFEPTGDAGHHYTGDYNVGKSYNANYMFATIEDAEAYVEFALTDDDMRLARQAHIASCDEWEAELDHYDFHDDDAYFDDRGDDDDRYYEYE